MGKRSILREVCGTAGQLGTNPRKFGKFMIQVRHGIDIEKVSIVQDLLNISEKAKFRIFTEQEICYCDQTPHPARHFAGRFCAKEALFKAIGCGWPRIALTQAEVNLDKSGSPRFTFYGELKAKILTPGILCTSLSITYTCDLALASVILLADQDFIFQIPEKPVE